MFRLISVDHILGVAQDEALFSNSTKKERWMLHRKPLSYGEHLRAASWPTFVYGGSHCDWFDLRFFK